MNYTEVIAKYLVKARDKAQDALDDSSRKGIDIDNYDVEDLIYSLEKIIDELENIEDFSSNSAIIDDIDDDFFDDDDEEDNW
jgi:hypothetical protein